MAYRTVVITTHGYYHFYVTSEQVQFKSVYYINETSKTSIKIGFLHEISVGIIQKRVLIMPVL